MRKISFFIIFLLSFVQFVQAESFTKADADKAYQENKYAEAIKMYENILATPVHLKIWQQEAKPQGAFVHYTQQEQILMDYLSQNQSISLNKYCKIARISRAKAETTLAKFIRFQLIEPIFENHHFFYRLTSCQTTETT